MSMAHLIPLLMYLEKLKQTMSLHPLPHATENRLYADLMDYLPHKLKLCETRPFFVCFQKIFDTFHNGTQTNHF